MTYFPFNYHIGATASKMRIFNTDSENGQEIKVDKVHGMKNIQLFSDKLTTHYRCI